MKKLLKLFSLLLGSSLVLAGCNDFEPNWPMEEPSEEDMAIDTPWVDYSVSCASITLGKGENALELNKGQTHQYTYTVEPRNASLSSLLWESDNPGVATINNGLLTAVGGGSANITVTSGDAVARSRVKVTVPIENFEISNKSLDLDLGEKVQLLAAFTPSDTTQNGLTYTLDSDEVVSVSETGLVTAKAAGSAQIRVTNEVMNKVETVEISVSDKWNYVQSLSLSGPANVEITKTGTIACDVVAQDTTKDASTLAYHNVKFSEKKANESDPSLISIDEATGEFTALGLGDATIVAKLYDDRKGEDVTSEINVHIFEVNATAITISPTTPIELDNATHLSAQLSYEITVDTAGYTAPSRGRITFSTSNSAVATVSDDGLVEPVGPGDATIKAKYINPNYELESGTVSVHVTAYAKSIAITCNSSEFYLDESLTITANVTPANTSSAIVWHYTDGTGHTFVENGDKLTITCNNLDHSVTVYASAEGSEGTLNSDPITLSPIEREINFEQGKTYIVGSSNYKTGVSKDAGAEGSWDKAKYAFVMTDKTGNAYALYEYKAVMTFRENDLWKIRENASDWREIEGYVGENESRHKIGYYKVTEGAFASGQMGVTAGGEVKVNEAGKYDIYYAYYKNDTTPAEGWYEVYVEEHGMKLSSTSVHAKYTSPQPTLSTITASNWEGTLRVDEVETSIITVDVGTLTGSIVITPVAIGETSFKVLDDVKEFTVHVTVTAGSSAAATGLYIRGTAAGGWNAVSAEYALREATDPNTTGEILDVYLTEGEFKIANADWSTAYGWDYDGHSTIIGGAAAKFSAGASDNNIKCNVAGYYNIYLTTNHYISIETVGGDEPSNLSPYYVRGTAVGSWDALPANQMTVSEGDNVAEFLGITLSVGEFKIADATWSKIWGYKYKNNGEAEDHITIKGAAAASFEEGASDGNIKCKVAGVYDIYLTNDNYISVNVHADPGVSYTVSFNNNGGSGSMADVPDQSGSYTLPANGFTAPEGYEFAGWKANNAGDTLAAGASYALSADVTFYAQWQLPYVANNVTLYLTANWSGWESPKAYVYDTSNSNTPKVAWPGEAMTYVGVNNDNDTIFSYTVDINTYDKIIFHNGSGGDNNQTVDFDISTAVNADAYYLSGHVGGDDANKIEITKWGTYTSDALTSKEIVYFTNNKGWSDPNFYVFNSSTSTELTAWPGNAAKWVAENEYHQGVYRLAIDTTAYDSFIFNGGGNQTVNILVSSLTSGNNAFFISDTVDGEGHFEVGQWAYNPLA